MIYEDEDIEDVETYENLTEKLETLQKYFELMSLDLELLEIPQFSPLKFGMAPAVFDWCSGDSLGCIISKYNVQEGTFVRLILRLDECCREMIKVSELIGNDKLIEKFSSASEILLRDIVFTPSLYV